jgi:hypothetical protein
MDHKEEVLVDFRKRSNFDYQKIVNYKVEDNDDDET